MANYNKSVNFAVMDTLQAGDPQKIVSGAEIDTEFNNISSSSTTKIDKVPAAQTNNIAIFNATGAVQDSGTTIDSVLPSGIISMWSGGIASIPSGWSLCDGSNGTPDLRNRFVVGAGDSYNPNDTGGSNSVTLTESQMPSHDHSMNSAGSHTHSGSTSTDGAHNHTGSIFQASTPVTNLFGAGSVNGGGSATTSTAGNHNHGLNINSNGNHTHNINNAGGGQSHENRPPYFALAYIMKI